MTKAHGKQAMPLVLLFWVRLNTPILVIPLQSQTTASDQGKVIKNEMSTKASEVAGLVLVKDSLPEQQTTL